MNNAHRAKSNHESASADYELVMVTYFSASNVSDFLETVGPGLPLVIIDNAQGRDGVGALAAGREHTRHQHGPGRGFAVAANIGLRTSSARYLVFVNPDSRPTPRIIESLVADLRADDRLGAVAALMTNMDGSTERGVGGWEPTPLRAVVHALGLHKWQRFSKFGLYARPRASETIDVDWVTGACMAVPRQVLKDLGGFDERYFVYSEDVDFGNRLRKAGLRVRLRTDLAVRHMAGSSGGTPSTGMSRLKGASFTAYARRHLAPSAAIAVVLLEAMGASARTVVHRARAQPDQAALMAAYTQGLILGAELPDPNEVGSHSAV